MSKDMLTWAQYLNVASASHFATHHHLSPSFFCCVWCRNCCSGFCSCFDLFRLHTIEQYNSCNLPLTKAAPDISFSSNKKHLKQEPLFQACTPYHLRFTLKIVLLCLIEAQPLGVVFFFIALHLIHLTSSVFQLAIRHIRRVKTYHGSEKDSVSLKFSWFSFSPDREEQIH